MKNDLVGVQVYCKKNDKEGKIVAIDEAAGTYSIEVDGETKLVTESTFKRWYSALPGNNPESVVNSEPKATVSEDKTAAPKAGQTSQKPAKNGIGLELRDKFVSIVKSFEVAGVELFHNAEKKTDVIKLNGRNIFECSYAKNKFNVLAHPDSLSPDNKKRVSKMCPDSWGWVLKARFTFTSLDESPLMKSIISDGLYYRKEKKEDGKNE